VAGQIAESYEDVHRLLTDSETFTRLAAGHGGSFAPATEPFPQAVLARLEPHVREIAAAAVSVCRDGDGLDVARLSAMVPAKVAELIVQAGLDVPRKLVAEGIEPTAAAIASALTLLVDGPAVDADGLPLAVDEVLRWAPPIPVVSRLDGDGAVVGGRIDAANRDPLRFPDADRFDPDRTPNQHLSFGRGRHYCPGAALARMQVAITVQAALSDRG
jgi:cytochrome P450